MIPLARMERARFSIRSSSICVRGWNLLGRSRSVSISSARSGLETGESGMSALSPRPSAGRFSIMVRLRGRLDGRFTREQLTREGEIGVGAARLHVVENARKTMARRFAQADVARDDGLED